MKDATKTEIEDHLSAKIEKIELLSGGSIATVHKITLASGQSYVLKVCQGKEMAQAEMYGLSLLFESKEFRVPKIHLYRDDTLLMEHIKEAAMPETFFSNFGRTLARMHRQKGEKAGLESDNFIGATPQPNTRFRDNWIDFYWENRLVFQAQLALENGASFRLQEKLLSLEFTVKKILEESLERPCLLHGDLWPGNFLIDEKGAPVLIDPAAYFGHREADLAMTLLFGGFGPEFYRAYNDEYPLSEGWRERMSLYKLYHVLNHYNLFGGHYQDQALKLMEAIAVYPISV